MEDENNRRLVSKDWDNFKNLKEFIEAEKLSKHLQKKIHEFHESFLISKSYSIDELAKIPNLNWLYVRERKLYNRNREYFYFDGSFEIGMRSFQFDTKYYRCKPAGTNYSYNVYEPNDYEISFAELIAKTIRFSDTNITYDSNTKLTTIEQAEEECRKCNDLLRDKITEFVLYHKQNQRFILDTKNSPIGIITNDCTFKINEKDNQLIVGTTSQRDEKEFKIGGAGFANFGLDYVHNHYDLVFDISTNNLIDVIKTR